MSQQVLKDHARALSHRHGVHADFCERYLADRYPDASSSASVDDFLSGLGQTHRLYLEYAFGTNARGREALARFPAGSTPRRILDIGCGYGGTLKAFADAGDEALGLEIDPTLADYARLNLGDTPQARVLCEDIVACDAAGLGVFDLIFCSDVIEHVSDPDVVLDRIHGLLAPGGTLVMHVPNKDSIQQVLSDEHFCLFGFTLLSRQEGRELKRQMQGWDDPFHHMGQLLPLEHYVERLERSGLSIQVEHLQAGNEDPISMLRQAHEHLRQALDDERLSWFTKRELAHRLSRYSGEFAQAHVRSLASGRADDFVRRFVARTWTVFAVRHA